VINHSKRESYTIHAAIGQTIMTLAPEYERFNTFGDASSLGVRWRRWLRGLELMAESKDISAAHRKTALLLHYAGPHAQDIYFALSTECHCSHYSRVLLLPQGQVPKMNMFGRSDY
jgi:hypothetical protein